MSAIGGAGSVLALVSLALPGLGLMMACSTRLDPDPEGISAEAAPLTVGGCQCVSSGTCSALSYSDATADGKYVVTTFGGGSDTQSMACGGTADGSWAYVADKARFGCGAKLLVEANGKHCVAKVADCGPNRCVEQAAAGSCGSHFPVLDASPFITKYLLGVSSAGWSDGMIVTATQVDASSVVGCPGLVAGGSGGGSGAGGVAGGGGTGASSTGGAGGTGASSTGGAGTGASSTGGAGGTGGSGASSTGGAGGTGGSGASGTGGAGGAGAGGTAASEGGASGATSCSPPLCNGCSSCLELCVCDGIDEAQCEQICATSGEPAGPEPSYSCETVECALTGDPEPETSPVSSERPSESEPRTCGAASVVGARGSATGRGGSWLLALSVLACARRRRSCRGFEASPRKAPGATQPRRIGILPLMPARRGKPLPVRVHSSTAKAESCGRRSIHSGKSAYSD